MAFRPENLDIYRKLIDETFAACEPEEIENLRTALFSMMKTMPESQLDSATGKEFKKAQLVTHLIFMRKEYEKKGLTRLLAYTNISLIRYIDLTTIDKPFYQAGQAAMKIVKNPNF